MGIVPPVKALGGAPSIVLIIFIVFRIHFHLDLIFILSKQGTAVLLKVCRKKLYLGRNNVQGFPVIWLLTCLHFLTLMLRFNLLGFKIRIYLGLEWRDV